MARGSTKRGISPKASSSRTTKKAGSAGVNHKTPEAQEARDKLDQDVGKLLLQKKNLAGLGKGEIAKELGADATAVKASLNRLDRAGVVSSSGTTMNTVYKASANASSKLAGLAKKKPARQSASSPA